MSEPSLYIKCHYKKNNFDYMPGCTLYAQLKNDSSYLGYFVNDVTGQFYFTEGKFENRGSAMHLNNNQTFESNQWKVIHPQEFFTAIGVIWPPSATLNTI